MTATEKELLALERNFWTGDGKFYRENVDDSCLIAFGADRAGVMSNKEIALTAKDGNRWKHLDLELKGLIEPADDVAILSYQANATRSNGERYAALVSTGYARRDDGCSTSRRRWPRRMATRNSVGFSWDQEQDEFKSSRCPRGIGMAIGPSRNLTKTCATTASKRSDDGRRGLVGGPVHTGRRP